MSSIPTKFDDKEVKTQMIALKYRKEQEYTALEAIKACPNHSCALELYAGTGGLTRIYEQVFDTIITNDLNKAADTIFHKKAIDFLREVKEVILPVLGQNNKVIEKYDLIDFDCYGCPALEIQEYFKVRRNKDAPFVLRFSDGLGLWMKRNKKEEVIRKRYLIEGELPMFRVWDRHADLIDFFLKKIASQYGMQAEKICSVVTKHKNYVLGAYKFTNI